MRFWVCCRAEAPMWKQTLVIREIQVTWLHVCLQWELFKQSFAVHHGVDEQIFLPCSSPFTDKANCERAKNTRVKEFPTGTPKSMINAKRNQDWHYYYCKQHQGNLITGQAFTKIFTPFICMGYLEFGYADTWMCGIYSIPGFPDEKLRHLCVCRTNHWQPGREFSSWNKSNCYLDVNFRQSLEQ